MRGKQSLGAPGKLLSVECGRALAALLVVFYHIDKYYFDGVQYWSESAITGVFAFGHAGVEFFFVLSGFIMHMIHHQDIGHAGRAANFAGRRFERIYPFFWAILLVTLALAFLTGEGDADLRNPSLVLQSALLAGQDPLEAVVFVSWTLWHEILFYGLCFLMIARPALGIPAFVAWIIASAVVSPLNLQVPWPAYLTSFMNTLFAYGVACSALLVHARIPMPRFVLALGAGVFLATGLTDNYLNELPRELEISLYGLGSALALLGGVEAERSGLLKAPRLLTLLGQASFAIYLTHMLTLPVVAKLSDMAGLTTWVPDIIAFPTLVIAATVGGLAAHFWIEKPIIAIARTIRAALRQQSALAD